MSRNLKANQQGFTIIEVMIVLVIAAVILLIVFLAVPALQRNSRNTQRKNEVAGLLSAVNEWSNNSGGNWPTSSTQQSDALKNAKTTFYTSSNISISNLSTGGTKGNPNDVNKVILVTDAACGGTNGTDATYSSRGLVALYTVEAGAGPQQICLAS